MFAMRRVRLLLFLAVLLLLVEACKSNRMRIRTHRPGKDRMENLKAAADSTPAVAKPDTLTKDVKMLKSEQYNFLANLIINNMVRAQQAAYDGRYSEAEKLLLQTLKWYPTSDALMLLGSVYEVQGRPSSADSCWQEARRLDPSLEERIADLPRSGSGTTPKSNPPKSK
jgi:tetratricopeptide (TPR) repeat protein